MLNVVLWKGKDVDLSAYDYYTVADLLKHYLLALPEPLLTHALVPEALQNEGRFPVLEKRNIDWLWQRYLQHTTRTTI